MCSIDLFSIEPCTPYGKKEKQLNSFHLRCLRRILQFPWQERLAFYLHLQVQKGLPLQYWPFQPLRVLQNQTVNSKVLKLPFEMDGQLIKVSIIMKIYTCISQNQEKAIYE